MLLNSVENAHEQIHHVIWSQFLPVFKMPDCLVKFLEWIRVPQKLHMKVLYEVGVKMTPKKVVVILGILKTCENTPLF